MEKYRDYDVSLLLHSSFILRGVCALPRGGGGHCGILGFRHDGVDIRWRADRRFHENTGLVRNPDEAQDPCERFALKVVTFRPCSGTIRTAACIDDGRLLPSNKSFVTLFGREAEREPGLNNHIDEMLQDIWNSKIPHRQ